MTLRFRHCCAVCDDCGSTGEVYDEEGENPTECPTCEGHSRPCRCEELFDREVDRRIDLMREGW